MRSRSSTLPRRTAGLLLVLAILAGIGGAAEALTASATGPSSELSLRVQRPRQTITAGHKATYRLRITRECRPTPVCGLPHGRRAARVWLSVVSTLPRGLVATVRISVTRSLSDVLTIRTSASTRPGSYRVRIQGRLRRIRRGVSRLMRASTTVTIVVRSPARPGFGIAGTPQSVLASGVAGQLAPGVSSRLDLRLTNPQRVSLSISRVYVRIAAILRSQTGASGSCTAANFAVTQLSGVHSIVLPPSSTRTLQQLGIATAQWPTILMRDLPINQDGCENAAVDLDYSGASARSPR
jgi:hypothetical protein